MAGSGDQDTAAPPAAGTADGNTNNITEVTTTNPPSQSQPKVHPPRRDLAAAEAARRQDRPTTSVSSIDIQTLSFPDGSRGTFSTPGIRVVSQSTSPTGSPKAPLRRPASSSGYATPQADSLGLYNRTGGSEVPMDAASVVSFAPTVRPTGDLASLVAGDFHRKSRAWSLLRTQAASVQPFESSRTIRVPYALGDFDKEFEAIAELPDVEEEGSEEARLVQWKAKLKHYMILSSAGKPIWSRHGDLSLINSYMGVVQTIISFYEEASNPLQGFTAGNARFVIVTEGPLYLVAISRLGESDSQLRDQLRALYMQILSTLTLPALTNIFANRPSTDLRKPLQGTEGLLASLADSFTKGSPSALLGALECLRLRKSQRYAITHAFLKQRTDKLLYGLIVAGGKLVSVIRPRKHSLHPSDLQLIFNMLFESGGIKSGGGENWIPLCLPAFNNRGYLYMYVSFFEPDAPEPEKTSASEPSTPPTPPTVPPTSGPQDDEEAIAIILISPDKESFFDLREMREKVAQSLVKSGSMAIIRAAAAAGRSQVADIIRRPASTVQISHFLFKSRANVQFVMSSLAPEFFGNRNAKSGDSSTGSTSTSTSTSSEHQQREARRRLMTLYHQLHAAVHARHSHLKVLHCIGEDATSLAWVTPVFEFYCVAGPNASRAVVTQDANRIIQWTKREEERLFIIGGGVF